MAHRKYKHLKISRWWRRYEYKHSSLAVAAILLFVLTIDTALMQTLLSRITTLGLAGIFIAGVLFVSFFTAAPAVVLLAAAADNYNPLVIAVVAGLGSLVGDWIILKIFEEKVAYELFPLAKKFGFLPFIRLLKRKIFRPITLALGAFMIATPLPDEVGIALLGLSHLKIYKILLIAFVLNTVGIYAIVSVVRSVTLNN